MNKQFSEFMTPPQRRRYWCAATCSLAPPLIPATAVALTPAAVQSAAPPPPPPPPPLPPLSLPSTTTQEATPSVQQVVQAVFSKTFPHLILHRSTMVLYRPHQASRPLSSQHKVQQMFIHTQTFIHHGHCHAPHALPHFRSWSYHIIIPSRTGGL